jgi:transposase
MVMANSDVDGGAPSDYRRDRAGYPSDLRDAEWARPAPLIPKALPGGRPRKADMRAAINAILYLRRTGCPWRYLPRDSFPARSTVYNIFRSTSVMASGKRSGPSCTWGYASEWVGRPARRR